MYGDANANYRWYNLYSQFYPGEPYYTSVNYKTRFHNQITTLGNDQDMVQWLKIIQEQLYKSNYNLLNDDLIADIVSDIPVNGPNELRKIDGVYYFPHYPSESGMVDMGQVVTELATEMGVFDDPSEYVYNDIADAAQYATEIQFGKRAKYSYVDLDGDIYESFGIFDYNL